MNTIQLTGRLTRDPETRTTSNGKAMTRVRLAVDRMGRGDETGYIDVTSFGASGEAAARVLKQGWLIAVTGRIEYGEWETKDGGEKRSGHSVVGHIEFLAAPKGSTEEIPAPPAPAEDDIPF